MATKTPAIDIEPAVQPYFTTAGVATRGMGRDCASAAPAIRSTAIDVSTSARFITVSPFPSRGEPGQDEPGRPLLLRGGVERQAQVVGAAGLELGDPPQALVGGAHDLAGHEFLERRRGATHAHGVPLEGPGGLGDRGV